MEIDIDRLHYCVENLETLSPGEGKTFAQIQCIIGCIEVGVENISVICSAIDQDFIKDMFKRWCEGRLPIGGMAANRIWGPFELPYLIRFHSDCHSAFFDGCSPTFDMSRPSSIIAYGGQPGGNGDFKGSSGLVIDSAGAEGPKGYPLFNGGV